MRYSALSRAFEILSILAVTAVLARLLSPGEFGIFAMASVFTSVGSLLINMGTGDAIIRLEREYLDKELLNTIFWMNIIIGLIFAIILYLSGNLISNLYSNVVVGEVTSVMSLVIFFSAMMNVPNSLLERKIDFKKILIQRLIALPIAGLTAIFLAYNGFGVWSLVAQQITAVIIGVIALFILADWRPGFCISSTKLIAISNFSTYVSLAKISNYFVKKGDVFIVGKFLGSESLGIYSKGYQFSVGLLKTFNGIGIKVLYPALTTANKERKVDIYVNASRIFVYFYTLALIVGYLYGREIVLILLGHQWIKAAELLPLFFVISLFLGAASVGTHLIKAVGHAKVLLWMVLMHSISAVCSFLIGAYFYGLTGVLVGYCLSVVALYLVVTIYCLKILKISPIKLIWVFLQVCIPLFFIGLLAEHLEFYMNLEEPVVKLLSGVVFISGLSLLLGYFFDTYEFAVLRRLISFPN